MCTRYMRTILLCFPCCLRTYSNLHKNDYTIPGRQNQAYTHARLHLMQTHRSHWMCALLMATSPLSSQAHDDESIIMRSFCGSLAMSTLTATLLMANSVESYVAKRNQLLACIGENEGDVSSVGQTIMCTSFRSYHTYERNFRVHFVVNPSSKFLKHAETSTYYLDDFLLVSPVAPAAAENSSTYSNA